MNNQIRYQFNIVPETFFSTIHPHCKYLAENSPHELRQSSVGCHCIEDSLPCREILQFLTFKGRFAVNGILKMLFNDVIVSFPTTSVNNFNTMMEEMIYPIFTDKFSKKFSFLKKKGQNVVQNVIKIKTESDCVSYGLDCIVAIDRLNNTIQNFYRIFAILNKEYGGGNTSSKFEVKRNLGTLVANLNFQLGSNDVENLRTPDKSYEPAYVHSIQLQNDLRNLLGNIVPSNEITLTDMLSLLGYTDIMPDEPRKTVVSGNRGAASTSNDLEKTLTSTTSDQFNGTNWPKIQSLNSTAQDRLNCDFDAYSQRWDQYFLYLFHKSSCAQSNCTLGKYTVLQFHVTKHNMDTGHKKMI